MEDYINRQKKILKNLDPIIKNTGINLIAAKNTKSKMIHPDDYGLLFRQLSSKRKPRKMNYDESENQSQGYEHKTMVDYTVDLYLRDGYKVYRGGVGIKGIYAFADFAAEKDGTLVLGECLTMASMKKSGKLENKIQLAKYGELCLVVPNQIFDSPTIKDKLIEIKDGVKISILIYHDVFFGERDNKLTNFETYLFCINSADNIPPLSATVEKRKSNSKIIIGFDTKIPKSTKEIDLNETWGIIINKFMQNNRKTIFNSIRKRMSNQKYLYNFEPKNYAKPRYSKNDLLTFRIQNGRLEISYKTKWGKKVFNEHFIKLFEKKGIEDEIQYFLSLRL